MFECGGNNKRTTPRPVSMKAVLGAKRIFLAFQGIFHTETGVGSPRNNLPLGGPRPRPTLSLYHGRLAHLRADLLSLFTATHHDALIVLRCGRRPLSGNQLPFDYRLIAAVVVLQECRNGRVTRKCCLADPRTNTVGWLTSSSMCRVYSRAWYLMPRVVS